MCFFSRGDDGFFRFVKALIDDLSLQRFGVVGALPHQNEFFVRAKLDELLPVLLEPLFRGRGVLPAGIDDHVRIGKSPPLGKVRIDDRIPETDGHGDVHGVGNVPGGPLDDVRSVPAPGQLPVSFTR